MTESDTSPSSLNIRLRPLTPEDFEAVVELQLACFPNMETWERAQFDSQLRHFPEGQFGIELDGRLVASSSSLIVEYDEYTDWQDWKVMSDNGYIRNHDSDGDTL
jgi:hypothetical protein